MHHLITGDGVRRSRGKWGGGEMEALLDYALNHFRRIAGEKRPLSRRGAAEPAGILPEDPGRIPRRVDRERHQLDPLAEQPVSPERIAQTRHLPGDAGADVGAMGEHEARHPDGSGEIAGPQGIAVLYAPRKLRPTPGH